MKTKKNKDGSIRKKPGPKPGAKARKAKTKKPDRVVLVEGDIADEMAERLHAALGRAVLRMLGERK